MRNREVSSQQKMAANYAEERASEWECLSPIKFIGRKPNLASGDQALSRGVFELH